MCAEVVLDDDNKLKEPNLVYDYDWYPALKIARLLVDAKYRKEYRLGAELVKLALGTTKDRICPVAGCQFVVVDAKKSSVPFYEKQGFTLINTPANRARPTPVMFLDLLKAG